jgi:hypothetical protein
MKVNVVLFYLRNKQNVHYPSHIDNKCSSLSKTDFKPQLLTVTKQTVHFLHTLAFRLRFILWCVNKL